MGCSRLAFGNDVQQDSGFGGRLPQAPGIHPAKASLINASRLDRGNKRIPAGGHLNVRDVVVEAPVAAPAVSKEASALGSTQPTSITVTAVDGFPAETLVNASENSDLLVAGSRGGGGFARP